MFTLGPIGFTAPILLTALIALPILYLLLRAVPPAPIRRRFPGVALLLGLQDDTHQTDHTPWWLLVLRMLAVAAAIIGFAGPVLNPEDEPTGSGPLLILSDSSWASARDWSAETTRIEAILSRAARQGRPVALVQATDLPGGDLTFSPADAILPTIAGLTPNPWVPGDDLLAWVDQVPENTDTIWISDGLDHPQRTDVLSILTARGNVEIVQSSTKIFGLRPAAFSDDGIDITALRSHGDTPETAQIAAIGLDPAGIERPLVVDTLTWGTDQTETTLSLSLPPELRNRITRFDLTGPDHAGAVSLTDDGLRRREIALLAGRENSEGLQLLSPLHYLEQALAPSADLITGTLSDMLLANPDVIILADVANLTPTETEALTEWLDRGGLLVRFAGPRLAASDISRNDIDPLMPVRLRAGGRNVGGALSWGEPKSLAPFPDNSPFFGLAIPDDVTVSSQVMAQPDPNLSERVIAELADGTPLVTARDRGQGRIVLFHVTANADWSTLPLSGLFVNMLERLAISARPLNPSPEDLEGTTWSMVRSLDGFGRVAIEENRAGVDGALLGEGRASAMLPPGLYQSDGQSMALNVITHDQVLEPAVWPANIAVSGFETTREILFKGWVLGAALLLLMVDVIATLALSGKLRGPRAQAAAMVLGALMLAPEADAQTADDIAIRATSEVVLAHVLTGDARVDEAAERGLFGLSDTLYRRTSVEPAAPIGVNIETDEIAFFPMLYWPMTPDQPLPSPAAIDKLNRYLQSGGMIVFDTRDGHIAGIGSSTAEGRRLQAIAATLDIPALEPVPSDHVLTRSFYILQDFPGRHAGRQVWVEAAPADAELAEGMPFRDLNDGVSPVVIGGNDWAAAWAIDEAGNQMFPVGRGSAGERQRELALRFGVNLVMHVLSGNYKSDQVHVPDLLERLGQ